MVVWDMLMLVHCSVGWVGVVSWVVRERVARAGVKAGKRRNKDKGRRKGLRGGEEEEEKGTGSSFFVQRREPDQKPNLTRNHVVPPFPLVSHGNKTC